jgi:hypothetical protein
MTNKQLSPAAQAVLHSFWDAPVSPARNCQIAAALRELVVQLQYYQCCEDEGVEDMVLDARAILDVADELEGKK